MFANDASLKYTFLTVHDRDNMVRRLCTAQVAVSVVAPILAVVEAEYFLASGPVLTILGLVISRMAVARAWRKLLILGLTSPFLVSLICAIIAFFELGPDDAKPTMVILLVLNTVMTCCCMYTLRDSPSSSTSARGLRFGMLHLFGLTTCVCLALSLFRVLSGAHFVLVFAAASMVTWGLIAACVFAFVRKPNAI